MKAEYIIIYCILLLAGSGCSQKQPDVLPGKIKITPAQQQANENVNQIKQTNLDRARTQLKNPNLSKEKREELGRKIAAEEVADILKEAQSAH